ncbi:CPBP family intramembrane glutamic endopeptidase [Methylacidiphilum kamchatkense]|uniref:CPBP family intramembrane glutamic endopeptidase n=1 Tax=Methylacidiphilum kamchatkense TaxID=431057 RepID=UPI001FD13601|nr:CPBP family intramembrane glutamic endopeptidase [Methylacidiphilum kamchatkense]
MVLIFFSFILAAAISPFAYLLFSSISGPLSFVRFYHKILEIILLAGVFLFRKRLGLYRWEDIGFKRPVFRPLLYGLGWAIGIVGFSFVIEPDILGNISRFPQATGSIEDSLKIFSKAAAVALIEEVMMRGILLGVFLRSIGELPALVASSGVFALSHFLNNQPQNYPDFHLNLGSGFRVLLEMFQPVLRLEWISIQGLILFLLGLLLGIAYINGKNIWQPIGIHGGIVFLVHSQSWIEPERLLSDSKESVILVIFSAILWIFYRKYSGKSKGKLNVFFL